MSKPPKRIQRKRTKGWRMPKDAVYVGRPTQWGNPYQPTFTLNPKDPGHLYFRDEYPAGIGVVCSKEECIDLFRAYAVGRSIMQPEWLASLRGKDLACWCGEDDDCHVDILLELANA